MSRGLKAGLATALALACCASAQAQPRGRQAPFRTSSPGPAHMARTQPLQTSTILTSGGFIVLSDSALPFNALPSVTFPVPGLGFDFVHLAAITRNFKVSDISVLSTAQRLALARSLTPIVPVAVPFFPAPAQVIVLQQPPVVVLQQPAAPEETAQPAARVRSAEPAGASEPPRDVGEFVLVRRDGGLVFAVAFYIQGDRLTYVTREGVRRSLRLADLDKDATLRMNEERGTTVHLPA